MVKAVRAYVGLGSNLGDREANLKRAVEMLDAREGVSVVRVSSSIETEPLGGPEGQPKFVNAAAAVDTTLAPRELLRACQEIERSLGRTREVRWGPRTIDLDILLYDDWVVRESDLEIPHPRMTRRGFVLSTLAEIAPDARHPLFSETVREMVEGAERRLAAAQDPKGN
jgi:2-amino-4-hydroxy-6-hydroxymethyldihydropteridine diphosphokinase